MMPMMPIRARLARALLASMIALFAVIAGGQVQVTTYHNDNLRTGLNASESILNPSNVTPSRFGLLFSLPVDGQVFAEPLYLGSLSIAGKGLHNVVFVATEHNSVYAFDADNNLGPNAQPLWHVNLGPSVPNEDTGSGDIFPEIGITSTPVIYNKSFGTPLLVVESKTKTFDANGNAVYTHKLHELLVTSGAEAPGSPVTINGSVPGTGDASVRGTVAFNALIQQARPSLLLVPPAVSIFGPLSPSIKSIGGAGGTVYVSYASHGDNGPYHGWIFAYDVDSLRLLHIFNTTPNGRTDPSGYPLAAGGIWQGGAGPASDGTNIFFATGNGAFNPQAQSYGDAILKVGASSLNVLDYFAPSNQLNLDDYDTDLGSGGVMLLPSSASGLSGKSLLVQSGKEGTIYLLDTSNLGKYGATDKIVQELPYTMGGIWGAPAYYNNAVYFGPSYSSLVSFPIVNGRFTSTSATAYTPTNFQYPGPTPSISSLGQTNGIVWAIQADNYDTGSPALLHAYDARNVGTELYDAGTTQGRDLFSSCVKFATPMIVNGKVYVAGANAVGVFGLGSWAATPVISPSGGTYNSSVNVKVTDATPGAQIRYTLDGTTPTASSPLYTGPVSLAASATFKARGFLNGAGGSAPAEADYLINPVVGNGTGLFGSYYNNSQDPGGTPTATRLDSMINWNWNGASPISGVGGSNWAGEWTGHLQAMTTGTYTLSTNSDDGVEVFINGQLLINDYTYHGPTLDYGTVNLIAGRTYAIDIKFFQGSGGSVLQLFWSAPGLPTQLVPTSQLYPN